MEYFTVEPSPVYAGNASRPGYTYTPAAVVTTTAAEESSSDYSGWIFWLLLFFFIILLIALVYFYFSFSGPASELIDDAEQALNNVNAAAPVVQQAASDISTNLIPKVDEGVNKIEALIDKIDKLLPENSDTSLATIEAKIEALITKVENVDTSALKTYIEGGIQTNEVIAGLSPVIVDIRDCTCPTNNGNTLNNNNLTGGNRFAGTGSVRSHGRLV